MPALIPVSGRHALDKNVILVIDLARYNSVVRWYNSEPHAAEFRTVHATPEELRQALTPRLVSSVVFEASSQAGSVHDLCEEVRLPTTDASTTGEAWHWKRVKRKTDRDNALKIAPRVHSGWPALEKKMTKCHPRVAYEYAVDVLQGPLPTPIENWLTLQPFDAEGTKYQQKYIAFKRAYQSQPSPSNLSSPPP